MAIYTPPQRTITARLYTTCGWIRGTFHIAAKHSFLDALNYTTPFFKLSDVTLPYLGEHADYFSVRRSMVIAVVPEGDDEQLHLHHPSTGRYVRHNVVCLLETGAVDGTIGILESVRVSDYVLHHQGFHLLRDATSHGMDDDEPLPVVFVNTDRLVGITEREP